MAPIEPTEERTEERTEREEPSRPATLLEVASAVFWSFFGVRKGRDMLRDGASIKPAHVVIVGLAAGLAFVLVLLGLVRIVMSLAA